MKLLRILFIITLVFSYSPLFSLDDSLNVRPDDKEWNDYVFDNGLKDILNDSNSVEFKRATIDLLTGFSTPDYHKDFYTGDFEQIMSYELRLGFTDFRRIKRSTDILSYNYDYFYIGNALTDWTPDLAYNGKMRTDTWRFGFNNSKGYAYLLGEASNITLFHTDGIGWSKVSFLDPVPDTLSLNTIGAFSDSFRFGDHFEGGMKVRFGKNIGINAAFERAIVFPRHLFFYWMVSEIIEKASHGILNSFISEIRKSSPELVPVVYFVLKNALSYGLFELKKSKMNWPFNTTAPLMYDNFKVGLTFNF